MRSRWLLLAASVFALTLTPASDALGQTEVITYSPFNPKGKVLGSLKVKQRRGECFSSSFMVHRPKVVRCIAGSRLLDPCFKSPRVPQLFICPDTPWQQRVAAVRARLPQKHPILTGPPWALRVTGFDCRFASGATTSGPHGRLNYSCGPQTYLFGDPVTASPTWQIWLGHDPQGNDAQLVNVITAWL